MPTIYLIILLFSIFLSFDKLMIRLYDIELYDFGTVLNVGVGIGEGIPPHTQLLNSSTKLLVRQYC